MKGDLPIKRETFLSLYGITEDQIDTLRPMSSLKFSEINKIVSIILDKETSCGSIEWAKESEHSKEKEFVSAVFKIEECFPHENWDYVKMGIWIDDNFEINYFWDYHNKKGTGTTSRQLNNHHLVTAYLIREKFDIFNLNKKED